MKNENSTAPGAAPYSAPCCSREPRTAPRAVRIPDYSAPCCNQACFKSVRTAPRAVLISITRRSPFSFVPLHRFGAVAPGCGCTSFQGLRPERRELHGAHPMRPLHPMQHVHQCTRFTTTVRDSTSTACALCGKPITNSPTGRPRTYCSAACRQKAYRNRLLLRNPLSRALGGVSLQLSAIRDPDTAHSAISDPAAANEFTWQACTGDSRA